jgi:hypothetical protein
MGSEQIGQQRWRCWVATTPTDSCSCFQPNLWSFGRASERSTALRPLEWADTAPSRTNRKHNNFLEAASVSLRSPCSRRRPRRRPLAWLRSPGAHNTDRSESIEVVAPPCSQMWRGAGAVSTPHSGWGKIHSLHAFLDEIDLQGAWYCHLGLSAAMKWTEGGV